MGRYRGGSCPLNRGFSSAHERQYKQFLAFLDEPSISAIKANSYEILLIATQPSARRRGLAPALLEAIRQRAHDDGKEVMLLTQCTERAEGTYARAGYRTVYQTELVYRDGERDPWFVMVR
jgi:GNAT superfamily N-acetyltransferase